jgi:hypothetical protein
LQTAQTQGEVDRTAADSGTTAESRATERKQGRKKRKKKKALSIKE